MIYKESKTKIKDSYVEFSENDLFNLYYRDRFNTIEFAETNCKLDYEVKRKDLNNKFYLTLDEMDKIREEIKNMNKKERIESLNDFVLENCDNKKLKEILEDTIILNVNSEMVTEKIELVEMKTDFEYVDIKQTDFNNIKEDLEKNPFIKVFGDGDYSFIKTKNGEEYILLKNDDDTFTALDKDFIQKMIEKYNEKDFYIDEPTADNSVVDKFSNSENDFIRERHFEMEL